MTCHRTKSCRSLLYIVAHHHVIGSISGVVAIQPCVHFGWSMTDVLLVSRLPSAPLQWLVCRSANGMMRSTCRARSISRSSRNAVLVAHGHFRGTLDLVRSTGNQQHMKQRQTGGHLVASILRRIHCNAKYAMQDLNRASTCPTSTVNRRCIPRRSCADVFKGRRNMHPTMPNRTTHHEG